MFPKEGMYMSFKIQKQKLMMVANDFYRATGIQLLILDTERSLIASAGLADPHFCDIVQEIDNSSACAAADRYILDKCALSQKPEMHICHAGLIDIALPLIYESRVCGFLIMGRMRRDISFEQTGFVCPEGYRDILKEKYDSLPIYGEERAMSILSLASMLASYIMVGDMIVSETSSLGELITKYIRDNLHRSISVAEICRHVGASKNTLNRSMRRFNGMSVSEYIISQRMELAKRLLSDTGDSVAAICEQIGISDPSYFSRQFKKHTGTTPVKYRKSRAGRAY